MSWMNMKLAKREMLSKRWLATTLDTTLGKVFYDAWYESKNSTGTDQKTVVDYLL